MQEQASEKTVVPINQNARTFISTLIALGGIFMIHAAVTWRGQPLLLTAFLVVAALASTLKVRVPGIPGTFSANCLVTVLAIAQMTVADVVFVGVVCALVQSKWHAKQRPAAVQMAFNAAVFVISGTAGGWTYAALQIFAPGLPGVASLVIAACVFFTVNTGSVSVVMALIEGLSPLQAWRTWHVWSLPYYLVNIAAAVLIMSVTPTSVIVVVAMILPLILLPFAGYHWFMRRVAPAIAQAS